MRVLIIGGDGMAGHIIRGYFSSETQYEVWWTTRRTITDNPKCLYLDVKNDEDLKKNLVFVKPDVVINAVGLLNDTATQNFLDAILINGILPHRLSEYSNKYGFYFIHISTDCVFSGKKGNYIENAQKDGSSVYAQSKSLGEVTGDNILTIRTSIIGPELKNNGIGLFHWFMAQQGEIKGYKNVFWNGVTTLELAKVIHRLINKQMEGLIHLTGNKKISKFELLMLLKEIFKKNDVTILPDSQKRSDKSLIITRKDVPYQPIDYSVMISELKQWMETQPELYQSYLK